LNFNSLKYGLFLPIVFVIFWLSPPKWRVKILLLASYIFYITWRPVYFFLIFGLTVGNYWLAKCIWRATTNKKAWMIAAVSLNIATLAYFKYFYFLEDSILFLFKPIFPHLDKIAINIILPLGISFFVFEFVHYIVDVYKGHEPVDDFVDFALFPSFFPTQIAGPIKRYEDFVPQLKVEHRFSWVEFDEGIFLILAGLAKKVLLADNLALFVDGGFTNLNLFTGLDAWVFSIAFAFQVWFDFSGYADIARGSAKLFGYKVPINFNFPYLSSSIAEFWRRWHITLGSWLRDYLYIPLGGSRNGRFNTSRNLVITMALGGLWHGAEFHYILWGIYQGVMLSLHREFRMLREASPAAYKWLDTQIGNAFSIVLTFFVAVIGMAIFRAENTQTVGLLLQKLFFINNAGAVQTAFMALPKINYPLVYPCVFLILPAIMIGQVLVRRFLTTGRFDQFPRPVKIITGTALIFAIVMFAPDNAPTFIYYQF
jgi:alginate O-acetyltransferase complex protein AlgI